MSSNLRRSVGILYNYGLRVEVPKIKLTRPHVGPTAYKVSRVH